MEVKIEQSWKKVLKEEFDKGYFEQIVVFLKHEKLTGKRIYPPGHQIFNAFDSTPFDEVKVVILGQDPYHGPGQAHGLSFSVLDGVKPPPSLQNMYKELQEDIGLPIPQTGNLSSWAANGVLLLNSILTVRDGEPGSHSKIGWEHFTDAVIRKISQEKEQVVFMLWGNFAQSKQSLIDATKHLILKAAHPSPFSVHKGFYGCRHFSKANEYLVRHGKNPVNWQPKPTTP
jgi:uracil-DNA glycosylase